MSMSRERRLILGGILCVTSCLLLSAFAVNSSFAWESAAAAQDVRGLDRRISYLEQRLYSIETRINQLERSSSSQRPNAPLPSTRDPEINQLQADNRTLQLRLNEVECGLLKLDERTTPTVAREGRGIPGKAVDPCRLSPATPVRLSNRP